MMNIGTSPGEHHASGTRQYLVKVFLCLLMISVFTNILITSNVLTPSMQPMMRHSQAGFDIPRERRMTTATTRQNPLNIIIFYPDDWGARDVQDVNPVLKTPTFSQLAKEGIRFTHNAVTTSICWISRATLFTGQYVSSHMSTYLFRPTFATPERWKGSWVYLLQKVGYFVGHIGKWQYQDKHKNKGSLFNFSSFFEGWVVMKGESGQPIYNVELAVNETVRFLEERPKDRPFAVTVAFYPPKGVALKEDVHPKYMAMYHNITHPEPYDLAMAYKRLPAFLRNNQTQARSRYLFRYETHGNYQQTTAAQYATLTHIDTAVGMVIQKLKDEGIFDNTLVMVTADNGEFHGAHSLADKWYPYSESIHVPLIIRDPRMPKQKRGTLDHSFTLNIDLASTILGAAGIQSPPYMDGRDIADLYLKDRASGREEFYYEFPAIQSGIPASRALVRKNFKYIDWFQHGYQELFDMNNDPFELKNLSNDPDYSSVIAEMRHQLEVLRHDVYTAHGLVPGTVCDSLWPAGSDLSKVPNCSITFPNKCCM